MADRQRLDLALEARGLLPSRARARDAILRGTVSVNGIIAAKPHQMVSESDAIALDDPAARYVSRAALKLIAGLDAAALDVRGLVCLDVGASTGGFTQVLVERGAARVYAVDVGHDQLDTKVASLSGVVSMEGLNARDLTREHIAEPVDLLVCDVSFVSVTKVLRAPLSLCRGGAHAIVLVKPQFEVGLDGIGKGGIVRDEALVRNAEENVVAFMQNEGWSHMMSLPSPLTGGDGNLETVAVFAKG